MSPIADRKVTDDSTLTGANLATADWFDVVDTSDTQDAATGTSKKMAPAEVAIGLGRSTTGGGVANPGVVSGAADPAIANTETVVKSVTVVANEVTANTAWLIQAYFTKSGTTSAAATIRVRMGPTTLTGAIIGTLTCPTDTLASPGMIEALVQVRDISVPSSTSMIGQITRLVHLAAVTISPAIGVSIGGTTVNTTVQTLLELTFISGNAANTYTFPSVSITKISA